jgi:hypothetical protein
LDIDLSKLSGIIDLESATRPHIESAIKNCPLKITNVGPKRTTKAEFFPELFNRIGEVDDLIFFYIAKLCDELYNGADIEIYSIDTDALTSGLIYLDKKNREKGGLGKYTTQLFVRFEPGPNWVFTKGGVYHTMQKWMHINKIHMDIEMANFSGAPDPPKKRDPKKRKKTNEIPESYALTSEEREGFLSLEYKTLTLGTRLSIYAYLCHF